MPREARTQEADDHAMEEALAATAAASIQPATASDFARAPDPVRDAVELERRKVAVEIDDLQRQLTEELIGRDVELSLLRGGVLHTVRVRPGESV